jgi:hypothetical protein
VHYSSQSQSVQLAPWKSFYCRAESLVAISEQRTHGEAWFGTGQLMLVGGEGEAGKHPGAREHPLVATACLTMVRGGVPARTATPAAQNMRHGGGHGAPVHV